MSKLWHYRKPAPIEPQQRKKKFASVCAFYDCKFHAWMISKEDDVTKLCGICRAMGHVEKAGDNRCANYIRSDVFTPVFVGKKDLETEGDNNNVDSDG